MSCLANSKCTVDAHLLFLLFLCWVSQRLLEMGVWMETVNQVPSCNSLARGFTTYYSPRKAQVKLHSCGNC